MTFFFFVFEIKSRGLSHKCINTRFEKLTLNNQIISLGIEFVMADFQDFIVIEALMSFPFTNNPCVSVQLVQVRKARRSHVWVDLILETVTHSFFGRRP